MIARESGIDTQSSCGVFPVQLCSRDFGLLAARCFATAKMMPAFAFVAMLSRLAVE